VGFTCEKSAQKTAQKTALAVPLHFEFKIVLNDLPSADFCAVFMLVFQAQLHSMKGSISRTTLGEDYIP
jgi:hypothetical protein